MARINSVEFERAILLSLINNANFRKYSVEDLDVEIFADSESQLLYSYIEKLNRRGEEIGWLSIENQINSDYSLSDDKAKKLLEIIGVFKNYTHDQCESFFLQIKNSVEKHVTVRKLQRAMQLAVSCLRNNDTEAAIYALKDLDKTTKFQQRDVSSFQDRLEILSKEDYEIWEPGIPLCINGIDTKSQVEKCIDEYLVFAGSKPGHLILLQGSSNYGKTTLMLNMATAHMLLGYRVAVFSLEMTYEYLNYRTYSGLSGLSSRDLKSYKGREIAHELREILKNYPNAKDIFWNDYHNKPFTPDRLDLDLTMFRNEGKRIDVAYLDFVDIMSTNRRYDSDWKRVEGICRDVQEVCSQHDCLAIVNSQSSKLALKEGSSGATVGNSYGKIQACDLNLALNRKEEDITDLDGNPLGHYGYYLTLDKNRYGEAGNTLKLSEANLRKAQFFDIRASVDMLLHN